MVLSVMFLFFEVFVAFLFYLVLLWFILLFYSLLFLLFAYHVLYNHVLYMICLVVFVLWDREWMMPLRFIRSTNTVLFFFLCLFSFCYRCFVCWYECASF